MESKNAAYTNEYLEYRKQFDYIFVDKYKSDDDEVKNLSDGKHTLVTSYYNDYRYEIHKYSVCTSKTQVIDNSGTTVAEVCNISYSVDFFSEVEHTNGKRFLLFSIDLYGYSIMDLSDYNVYHYIPVESFIGHEETFIWTNVLYCSQNNILAVDGCFWAAPSSTNFYNFSCPERLPYELVYSSYDMAGVVNVDSDVIPLRWNDDGTIVLKCCVDAEGVEEIEKIVDVISQSKNSSQ